MKQLTALAWKEWHEARAFLWIALGVFVGLPLIAGLEGMVQYSRRFEVSAVPWVLVFGGVPAIFVAVGGTCRDLRGRLEDFWQSRPVGVGQWLGVKYFVGLMVALVACAAPMVLQFFLNRDRDWATSGACFLAMLPAFFSFGFLAGCLVRRAAHAAMLALAGMLLIYFLPAIVPPLNWLSSVNINSGDSIVGYLAGMIGIAIIPTAIAFIAVGRGWRVESGRKMMYGAVGAAILILFWSAAYQLGTNMPILQEVSLPHGEVAVTIHCDGDRGFVITRRLYEVPATQPEDRWKSDFEYRSLEVTPTGVRLGEKQDANALNTWWGLRDASPAGHPEISYLAYVDEDIQRPNIWCNLQVRDVKRNTFKETRLWEKSGYDWTKSDWAGFGFVYCYVSNNRLYVVGPQLVTLEISDPDKPKVVANVEYFSTAIRENLSELEQSNHRAAWMLDSGGNVEKKIFIKLDKIPDLSAKQRLDAMMGAMRKHMASDFDGTVWCRIDGDDLVAYRLTKLTDDIATFELSGQHSPSILEAVFGHAQYPAMSIENGLIYMSDQPAWSTWTGREPINPHVSVFDVREPGRIRLVGHFAVPGALFPTPLPDGRALVDGTSVWLIGPPPGYGK